MQKEVAVRLGSASEHERSRLKAALITRMMHQRDIFLSLATITSILRLFMVLPFALLPVTPRQCLAYTDTVTSVHSPLKVDLGEPLQINLPATHLSLCSLHQS